jgi:hypothetical protein
MRLAVALFAAAIASPAVASQPGQPLDCSDWQFVQPGFACQEWKVCEPSRCYLGTQDRLVENSGTILYLERGVSTGSSCGVTPLRRTQIVRESATGPEVLAFVDDRCVEPVSEHGDSTDYVDARTPILFDAVRGSLRIDALSANTRADYGSRASVLEFVGFAPLFDVLQSFAPSSDVSFRVPAMPEGLGGADHFDTYWGPLTKPIDFTQAHPLQCGYPATPPRAGDYEAVTDTLPTPAPDSGYYYVTATTYQGQARYGRKTTNGKLRGEGPRSPPRSVGRGTWSAGRRPGANFIHANAVAHASPRRSCRRLTYSGFNQLTVRNARRSVEATDQGEIRPLARVGIDVDTVDLYGWRAEKAKAAGFIFRPHFDGLYHDTPLRSGGATNELKRGVAIRTPLEIQDVNTHRCRASREFWPNIVSERVTHPCCLLASSPRRASTRSRLALK